MTKILPIIIGAFFWAWLTEVSTRGKYGVHKQSSVNYIPFFMLILTLALPVTLRNSFNDTFSYIRGFYLAEPITELFQSGNIHILGNPLFSIYRSLVRTFTDNYSIYFLFPAFFVQYSYLRFIRKHSPSLIVGVGLFLFLGTYVFSLAAMKQTIAMAILLYGVDALIDRKYLRFYLLVFVAFLFHTYAICFVILPLFTIKPWTFRTFLLLFGVFFVMQNFNSVIGSFLEFANDSGKSVSSEEVFGATGINPIRVMVYAVAPLFALVFRKYLFSGPEDREHNILVNMSIISVAIMAVGLVNAANMFGRMGQYFEFGMTCSLPWMLTKPFDQSSTRLVSFLAIVCFFGFFCYANLVQIYFDDQFSRYTVMEFLQSIWQDFVFG